MTLSLCTYYFYTTTLIVYPLLTINNRMPLFSHYCSMTFSYRTVQSLFSQLHASWTKINTKSQINVNRWSDWRRIHYSLSIGPVSSDCRYFWVNMLKNIECGNSIFILMIMIIRKKFCCLMDQKNTLNATIQNFTWDWIKTGKT